MTEFVLLFKMLTLLRPMVRLDSFCNEFAPICFVMYLALYPVSYIVLMRIFLANIHHQ